MPKPEEQETEAPEEKETEGETQDSSDGAGEKDSESTESEEAEAGDAAPSEKDSSGEEEGSESEGEEQPEDESVQSVVDAKLRTALEASVAKLGRLEGAGSKGAQNQLFEKLLSDLKDEIAGKKKGPEGPPDISDVDVKDPRAVQQYLDSRVKHFIVEALAPIQQNAALRDADLELTKLAKDHPDAYKYGKKMAAVIERYPQLPLEYAYRIVSSDERVKEGRNDAYNSMRKKKGANLSKSTAKPPSGDSSKKIKSKREAILAALDETGASFND